MKDFITYELSLELKQLGFDEPCFGYWYTEQEEFKKIDIQLSSIDFLEGEPDYVLAPTYSQAFRWLREKYGLHQHIEYIKAADRYDLWVGHYMRYTKTYEEAELACLKKLIEIVKGGNKWATINKVA